MSKNLFIYYIIIPIMAYSTIMSMLLNSNLSMWMMMEISSMTFIMFLNQTNKIKFSPMMYFIISAISSNLIIPYIFNMMDLYNLFYNLCIMGLMIKLSFFPFHIWLIMISFNLNWLSIFFMNTIQKIIPMILLINIINTEIFKFYILIMMSILISMFNILKNNNIKYIMSYSSINFSSWLIYLMLMNKFLGSLMFIYYTITFLNISLFFFKFNINNFHEMNFLNLNFSTKMLFFILMMNLSNFPPFSMFYFKWEIISNFSLNMNFPMMILLMLSSFLFIYIYTRMFYPLLIQSNLKNKFFTKTKWNKFFIIMNLILLILFLPIMILIKI